jgi:hypothetical protein
VTAPTWVVEPELVGQFANPWHDEAGMFAPKGRHGGGGGDGGGAAGGGAGLDAPDDAEYRALAADPAKVAANRAAFVAAHPEQGQAVVDVVAGWTGGGNDIDGVRARLASGDPATVAARKFIADAPANTVTLHRGVGIRSEADNEMWAAAKVGDTMPVQTISSFTESRNHAEYFPDDHAGLEGVMITLAPGSTPALPVGKLSNTPGEKEWMVAHDLRITSIKVRHTYNEDVEADTSWYEITAERA